mgnify:CR=1 FL=1
MIVMQPGQLRNTLPFILTYYTTGFITFQSEISISIDNCPKGGYNTAKPTNHIGLTGI